jgi:hypothetical protein
MPASIHTKDLRQNIQLTSKIEFKNGLEVTALWLVPQTNAQIIKVLNLHQRETMFPIHIILIISIY